MNITALSGRLTKDVEVRKTQSGLSVAQFTVAVDNGKDKPADFINCVVWRQGADFLGQYAHKGDLVGVTGRISTRNYERDGQKVYITEVTADRVEILAHKAQNQPQGSGNTYGQGNTYPSANPSQNAQNRPVSDDNRFPNDNPYDGWGSGLNLSNEDLPF